MTNTFELINDDCLVAMRKMGDNYFDSIVTDPPYELGFMGKSWDASGVAYNVEVWAEVLRILKPGGHLLAFGGSRTYHRLAVAIEDAGFQIRDSIAWIYGSGFPKSLDVSKSIDKAAGAEREVVTRLESDLFGFRQVDVSEIRMNEPSGIVGVGQGERKQVERKETKPSTPAAQQWQGWGTALKPAIEPIVMARKPLIGTVAENVLTWGVGGLNIDGSRIASNGEHKRSFQPSNAERNIYGEQSGFQPTNAQGRWPANIILDEVTAELLDEQTNHLHAAGNKKDTGKGLGRGYDSSSYEFSYKGREHRGHNDSGGASRFFYVAKASKRDRNEGLEDLEAVRHADRTKDDGASGENPRNRTNQTKQNFHPTVKPTQLMRYLVRLVTPPNGIVLDPFTGSGSTGKACMLESFNFVGIEQSKEYTNICEIRIKTAQQEKGLEPEQLELYE